MRRVADVRRQEAVERLWDSACHEPDEPRRDSGEERRNKPERQPDEVGEREKHAKEDSEAWALEIVRHAVEILVRADHIPEDLIVDLAGHKMGDTIRWSDIKGTEDVEPTITDRDFVIASIKTSSAAISAAADEAHDAEVAAEAAEVEATEQAASGEADVEATEDTDEG